MKITFSNQTHKASAMAKLIHFLDQVGAAEIEDSVVNAGVEPKLKLVAEVIESTYADGSPAGHRLRWNGRNAEDDLPEGTKLYTIINE